MWWWVARRLVVYSPYLGRPHGGTFCWHYAFFCTDVAYALFSVALPSTLFSVRFFAPSLQQCWTLNLFKFPSACILYLTLPLTYKCMFFDCTHIISAPFTYRPSTYKCFSTACRVSYNLYSITAGTYTIRPESLVKACYTNIARDLPCFGYKWKVCKHAHTTYVGPIFFDSVSFLYDYFPF